MPEEYVFDYILFPTGRKSKKRPVINVPFKYLDREITLAALIDSGSDSNFSFKEIGEQMG